MHAYCMMGFCQMTQSYEMIDFLAEPRFAKWTS